MGAVETQVGGRSSHPAFDCSSFCLRGYPPPDPRVQALGSAGAQSILSAAPGGCSEGPRQEVSPGPGGGLAGGMSSPQPHTPVGGSRGGSVHLPSALQVPTVRPPAQICKEAARWVRSRGPAVPASHLCCKAGATPSASVSQMPLHAGLSCTNKTVQDPLQRSTWGAGFTIQSCLTHPPHLSVGAGYAAGPRGSGMQRPCVNPVPPRRV